MEKILIRLRWYGARALAAQGALGLCGIVLCAVALVLAVAVVWPGQRESKLLVRELAQANARHAEHPTAAAPPTSDQELQAFYSILPHESEIPAILGALSSEAQRQGISLPEAEFKMVAATNTPIRKYQINLPIHADYRQTRAFLRAALHDYPSLALEGITLRRENAETTGLDCQLELALYLQPGHGGAS